jgi:hypothetical protein
MELGDVQVAIDLGPRIDTRTLPIERQVGRSIPALPLRVYVASIGDADRVINMLVGDTQRITEYARCGFAIEQPVPNEVNTAYQRWSTPGAPAA